MADWQKLVREIIVEPQLFLRREFAMQTPDEALQDAKGVNEPDAEELDQYEAEIREKFTGDLHE
jgi:hypothetical protein